MTRLRGRAALIDFYHRLAAQRLGNIALQALFCLPLLPVFLINETSFSPLFDFLRELPPVVARGSFLLLLLVLLLAWLCLLAWQERMWEGSYYATARHMLTENSLLLFILEPDYVDTLAPLPRVISQTTGEQRVANSIVSRVRHFLKYHGRYQHALFLWRERYAPQPDWRRSIWLFLQLTGLAALVFCLLFIVIGLGTLFLPFFAVFPLAGLALLKRQARNIGLTQAVFEELTGGAADRRGLSLHLNSRAKRQC
jgi:hypothetical protein